MSAPQLPAPEIQPTSPQFMRAYGRFWDVLSVSIFSFAALFILYSEREALAWQHWAAAGLMAAQGVLYVFSISMRGWPISRVWLALYFIGGVGMWLIAGWLYPSTWWIGMTYFGQMFGLLPPQAVIPGSFLINVLIILYINDWNFTTATPGQLFGFGFQWLGGMAVYLFIFNIIRTSQGRGALVAKLEAAQRELETTRQKDVELAALRERERLARDLHDSLGHALVAMTVQLEAIQRLYRVDPERGSAQIDELKGLTRRSMDDLRRSLNGLRASGLGERSLSESIQMLSVTVAQRANLQIDCRVAPEADALSPAVQETLWRVAQESLTNIEKHARARRVHLQLELQPHAVSIVVTDDGVGLSPTVESLSGHYGLRGMRERVESLGGTLNLKPAYPGTRIEAQLPIIASGLIASEQ